MDNQNINPEATEAHNIVTGPLDQEGKSTMENLNTATEPKRKNKAMLKRPAVCDPSTLPEILDLESCALLLGVTKSSVYYMVEHRQIPFRRAGKFIRFMKSVILAWLAGEPVAARK